MKRLFLLYIAVMMTQIVYCMQPQTEIILHEMDALLRAEAKNYGAIADLLWEATETPVQLPLLFDKINAQASQEECSRIVRFVLSHGTDLHDFLFSQLFIKGTIQFQAGEQSKMKWYDVSPRGNFLIGQVSEQVFYGDLRTRPLNVMAQKILAHPTHDFQYAFSENEDWLVYAHYPYIYRTNLRTSKIEKIIYPYNKLKSDALYGIKIEALTDCFAVLSRSDKRAVSDQEKDILKVYECKGQIADRRFVNELKIMRFDEPTRTIDFNDTNKRYAVLGMCPKKKFIIIQDGYSAKILFDLCSKRSFPLINNVNTEFSSNGDYLIQGVGTQTLSYVDLREDTLSNIPLCSARPGMVFDNVMVLAERYVIAREVFPGASETLVYNPSQGWHRNIGGKQGRLYIMDMVEHAVKCRDLFGTYVVSPMGNHIAWALNHDLYIYDIGRQIEKRLSLDKAYKPQALSPKGIYVVASCDDSTNEATVFSVESQERLTRIPLMSYYMFYKNDDRYLMGLKQSLHGCCKTYVHACKKIVGSAFYMWNLGSKKCIGRWENSMSSHDTSLLNLYEYQSFPVLALRCSEQQQSFSLLSINDVIAHDTQLESLSHVEQAMQLALLSNKVTMGQHIESLSEMALKELLVSSVVPFESFSYSFVTSANRIQEYDECLQSIAQYVQAHSVPACGYMNAKRQKTIDDHNVRGMITGACAQWFQPLSEEYMSALQSKAQRVDESFTAIDSLMKEYYLLPVPAQELVSTMNCQGVLLPNYFKLCAVMRGLASKQGISLLPSRSWLYSVLDVYLTWAPKLKNILEKQIKLAKIVFYFNEGIEEADSDALKNVAVLFRNYLASFNTNDIDQICQCRSRLYVQLHALFGSNFTLNQMLPLCKLTSIRLEILLFGEQLFNVFSMISESQEQKLGVIRGIETNRQEYISFIDEAKDLGCGILGSFLRKLKEIRVDSNVQILDNLQLACLSVLPQYKLLYEKIPNLRAWASKVYAATIFCQCHPDMVDSKSFASSLEVLNAFGCSKAKSIKAFAKQLRDSQISLTMESFLQLLKKEVGIPLYPKDMIYLYLSNILCMNLVRGDRQELETFFEKLCKRNGSIDAFSGDTVLHMVTRYCAKKPEAYQIIDLPLMRFSPTDIMITNKSHKTPAELARELGDENLAARIYQCCP